MKLGPHIDIYIVIYKAAATQTEIVIQVQTQLPKYIGLPTRTITFVLLVKVTFIKSSNIVRISLTRLWHDNYSI